MKTITESGMNFGEYEEENLFHIENSEIYRNLGKGIRTVEFILKYGNNSILFLEAKKSCPNAANKNESDEKAKKFEEYYTSITEKFVASLQVYLAMILGRYEINLECGFLLRDTDCLKVASLEFVLVIKDVEDVAWLAGPKAELEARLRQFRKIWGVRIRVLNEEQARKLKLVQ